MQTKPTIIYLMGPTASGKTQLAIDLVQCFPLEIISVDSALIYRDMNIGTAKPTAVELESAPHRLIDICDPAEIYSVGQFCQDAASEIEAIINLGKIPILVGGTMLYFSSLQSGLAKLPTAKPPLREAITEEAQACGWQEMHRKLAAFDPYYASKIHPNDSQRIQRAHEVYRTSGKTMTEFHHQQQSKTKYNVIPYILAPTERKILHQRIENRFDNMLTEGLIDEVINLRKRGDLHPNLPSLRTVGYRQVWQYLAGEYDQLTMRAKAIAATRQLAKRQLTWLRRWNPVDWFDVSHESHRNKLKNDLKIKLDKLNGY